jgi:hypothetical protein
MTKMLLFEQFQLTIFAPRQLSPETTVAMRRTLIGRRFGADMRRAVRAVVRRYPVLRSVRISVAL